MKRSSRHSSVHILLNFRNAFPNCLAAEFADHEDVCGIMWVLPLFSRLAPKAQEKSKPEMWKVGIFIAESYVKSLWNLSPISTLFSHRFEARSELDQAS